MADVIASDVQWTISEAPSCKNTSSSWAWNGFILDQYISHSAQSKFPLLWACVWCPVVSIISALKMSWGHCPFPKSLMQFIQNIMCCRHTYRMPSIFCHHWRPTYDLHHMQSAGEFKSGIWCALLGSLGCFVFFLVGVFVCLDRIESQYHHRHGKPRPVNYLMG